MTEGHVSSLGLNSAEHEQDGVMLSPEDVAWAESCLSKDPEMLDSGWNSLKDALLETLDAQQHASPYEGNDYLEEAKMEIFSSVNTGNICKIEDKAAISIADNIEGADSYWNSPEYALLETFSAQYHSEIFSSLNTGNICKIEDKAAVSIADNIEGADSYWNSPEYALLETFSSQYHSSPNDRGNSSSVLQPPVKEVHSSEDINDMHDSDKTPIGIAAVVAEPNRDDPLNHEPADDFWSTHNLEDVFLPTYNENLRDLGISDLEVDLVFQEFQSEQLTEDIFKIWDFDIPPEENDLMRQLNKALAENSLEPTPPVSDDSETWRGLPDESLDGLISGIADLALSPSSG